MTEPPIDAEAVRHLIAEAGVARDAADAALVKARRLAAEAGIATDGDGGDDVLTVQRVNIVEPDGTLRLAISNRARFPGIVYHGHETPHPDRDDVAGLIFFNDEATEDGGLVWAGAGTGNGYHSGVHLSFDNYEQDQSLVLQSIDESREHRRQVIAFIDRPDWPLADLIALTPEKVDDFLATHEQAVPRMRLAREEDASVGLTLRDQHGRPRIELRVSSDGNSSITLLDAEGNITARLPQ